MASERPCRRPGPCGRAGGARSAVWDRDGRQWGPGLRFFARPVGAPFALRGEAEDLVPVSGGFRLQFESWLERRYSAADLSNQWALNDRQANSMTIAARLVPLWGREERGTK